MLARSRSRFRGRAQPNPWLDTAAFYGATDAWDFTSDQYIRAGLIAPSGLTVTRASSGYAQREDGIWVNFGSGVLRRTDKGALIETARTNRALYSRDLTQAAWTATNVTVARNQIGIDGTANSACSLTATAGNGTVLQAVTHASTARYFSVWIKRITGTGTVEVTLDNGSTWTGVTVTSAYTRVGATQTLADPTVGVRLVTSGDAVAVDFAQLEDGGAPTSPILTEGADATRLAEVVTATLVSGDYPQTLYGEWFQPVNPAVTGIVMQLDNGSSTDRVQLAVSSLPAWQQITVSGGSTQALTQEGTPVYGQVCKMAVRVATDDVRMAVNGTLYTADTLVTVPVGTTTLRFGTQHTSVFQLQGYIRAVARLPLVLTDAQLQAVTGV